MRTRIVEAAAGLLANAADVDISTRAACEAAGVTAPTLYHHFGDKQGLLAAVVDFGWRPSSRPSARWPQSCASTWRTTFGRVGTITSSSHARPELLQADVVTGDWREQRVLRQRLPDAPRADGAWRGTRSVACVCRSGRTNGHGRDDWRRIVGHSQPELFGDDAFASQLREAVIAAVTVADPSPMSTRRLAEAGAPTAAAAAATLKSKLTVEDSPLTAPEQQLMQQWLTAIADGAPRSKS